MPKSKGGGNTWDNLVAACHTCNTKKGDKLLEHTGMKLAKKPKAPYSKMQFMLTNTNISEWAEYAF